MKILHVVPSFHPAYSYGGPIRSTFELCRNTVELGGDVRVLTTDANGLDRVLDVDNNEEVQLPEGFRVRYCPRRLRHSVSPTLMRLLPTYMRWADVVHLTGVYNFPTFPTIFWGSFIEQAADLVTAGGASALGRLVTSRTKGGLGFSVVSHSQSR